MSPEIILTFIAACVLLGLTPGPNMALIIANTLTNGLGAGLVTLAGTTVGLAILVATAAAGMSSIMVLMAEWFDVLRWAGALYLAYLGARQLWIMWHRSSVPLQPAPLRSSGSRFAQGLFVSLSNPKVIFFLGAFLPQFIDPGGDTVWQLTVLAVLFTVVLAIVDIGYTVALAKARTRFNTARLRVLDGVAGALLLLGGAALAMARRP
jgi:threonine/homoserine/homoserine lactone efflux protein